MNTVLEALRDAALNHSDSMGALHIRNRSRKKAIFYLRDGALFAVEIPGEVPPLVNRISWCIDSSVNQEDVSQISRVVDPIELPFVLLQHQIMPERLLHPIVREFFLSTCEEIVSWGNVRGIWRRGEHPSQHMGYRVSPITITQLSQILSRRSNDIRVFADHIGVPAEKVLEIRIVAADITYNPNDDHENIILTYAKKNLTFEEIVVQNKMVGADYLARAIYILWDSRVIDLMFDNALLPHVESINDTESDRNINNNKEKQVDTEVDNTPTDESAEFFPLVQERTSEELPDGPVDGYERPFSTTLTSELGSLETPDSEPTTIDTEDFPLTGDLDGLFSELSSILLKVKSALSDKESKYSTLSAELIHVDEEIIVLTDRKAELVKEIESAWAGKESLKKRLQELSNQ